MMSRVDLYPIYDEYLVILMYDMMVSAWYHDLIASTRMALYA